MKDKENLLRRNLFPILLKNESDGLDDLKINLSIGMWIWTIQFSE